MSKYIQTTIDNVDEDYWTGEPVDCWCEHHKNYHSWFGCRACYRMQRFYDMRHAYNLPVAHVDTTDD